MPPFLDTNILVYRYSQDARRVRARELVEGRWQTSVQVLGEFALASHRKLKLPWSEIEDALADLLEMEQTLHPITIETHLRAVRVAQRYQLRFYDAMIVAAALLAGADTLLSEDMHAGLVIDNRLTIVNPFA